MRREHSIRELSDSSTIWDVAVIGGGATGLGAAVDAAARGYKTLLLEQADFAKGTSSRSTKLIHGGVRYLQQGNISLVRESLHERGLLCKNAPHLVHDLPFIVPTYDWWETPFYGVGLKIYDVLAGSLGLGPSKRLSREETLKHIPTVESKGLRGGVIYHDAQFDDARLAVDLAHTLSGLGGIPINYMPVIGLLKTSARVIGVRSCDEETGMIYEIKARAVINATGVFTDAVRKMDDEAVKPIVAASQGIHFVLDRSFLPGDSAIMVPHTDDGRVLFAVPWHDRVLIGTTDTPIKKISLEPRALEEEIQFLLKHASRYLTKDPTPNDVLSVFAGLRPLVKKNETKRTASLSRDHTILTSPSGLITITGGKWTTYRRMGEDVIDHAAETANLPNVPSRTATLPIHDSKFQSLEKKSSKNPAVGKSLHPKLPYTVGDVVWAVEEEMGRTVEDVLARRTRSLLLDARASIEAAPIVAKVLADVLNRDEVWQREQVTSYKTLAQGYLIGAGFGKAE